MLESGLVENAVVTSAQDDLIHLAISNHSGFIQRVQEGTIVGEAQVAQVLTSDTGYYNTAAEGPADVRRLSSSEQQREVTRGVTTTGCAPL